MEDDKRDGTTNDRHKIRIKRMITVEHKLKGRITKGRVRRVVMTTEQVVEVLERSEAYVHEQAGAQKAKVKIVAVRALA